MEALTNGQLEKDIILEMIEKPKHEQMGDMAFPCFQLAKIYRKSPTNIAQEIAEKLETDIFEKVEAVGAYVNVFLNKEIVSSKIINEIIEKKDKYGELELGIKKVVTIDFSSPNIAKPFSMGHLRSTVIGNVLAMIYEKCGYRPIRINHLGDWGTQFGKLIVAYKLWGNEETVRKQPIKELLHLYVTFHEEAEENKKLNDLGREAFKKLEENDEESVNLWKWFREESLKEFANIYDILGITFDSFKGEAFYNDKMDSVVKLLEDKALLEESDGAMVVTLEGMPPCLIKKRDGATLYATRDLAAAIYRQETHHFAKSLYIVGNEQTLHFKQLFTVLEKLGFAWNEGLSHVPFGMILKDGKKMSTRKGKVNFTEQDAWSVVSSLTAFPNVVQRAMEENNPSEIAKFVIELSKSFNKYYATVKILDENYKQERLSLVYAVKKVLEEGLYLLGIEAPEEM